MHLEILEDLQFILMIFQKLFCCFIHLRFFTFFNLHDLNRCAHATLVSYV